MQKLIERYLNYQRMRNASKQTIASYSRYLKILSEKIRTPEEITLGNLSEIPKEHEWGNGTVRLFIASCSSFFNFLLNEGVLQRNPLKGFPVSKLSSPDSRKYILSDKEMEHIISVCDKNLQLKDNVLTRLLIETGMRRDELVNVQVKNINLKDRSIYLETTKGSNPRTVFFTKPTGELIKKYVETLGGNNEPFKGYDIYMLVKKVMSLSFPFDKEKQKEVSPHTFRHSFATSWLQNNRHPIILKRIMGWKSLTMLNVYEHLQTDKLMKEYAMFEKKRG